VAPVTTKPIRQTYAKKNPLAPAWTGRPTLASMRIPTLDGLRGICISLVLLSHLSGTQHFVRSDIFELYGNLGVRTFFVLSGYLITAILTKEHAKAGGIALRDFYLRRAYRIVPPAYAFMLVAIATHWRVLSWANIAIALTFTSNYYYGGHYVLGHLWSLSAEEQFYLLWPLILVLFFRRRLWIIGGVLAAGPPLRIVLWMIWGRHGMGHPFPVLMDALAGGCALQMLQPQLVRYQRMFASRWFSLVPVVTALLPLMQLFSTRFYQGVGLSVLHVGIALSVQHVMASRYSVLNLRPVAWLGTISYSLYLWQQLFLNRASGEPWAAFPLNLVFAIGCGAASYYLVERPALRMRERFTRGGRSAAAPSLVAIPTAADQVSRAG